MAPRPNPEPGPGFAKPISLSGAGESGDYHYQEVVKGTLVHPVSKNHRRPATRLSVAEQIATGVPLGQLQFPRGEISRKERAFEEVIKDLRHVVGSIFRIRRNQTDQSKFDYFPLGSGFFVAPNLFFTCYHVVNSKQSPNLPGDGYLIVTSVGRTVHREQGCPNATEGTNLWLFPEHDAALLKVEASDSDQCYVSLDYSPVVCGQEIAIAGFPLQRPKALPDGRPDFGSLIFRVARNYVSSTYVADFDGNSMPALIKDLPQIEVNFMFVPGNSGGPVFNPITGRVMGYVDAFLHFPLQLANGKEAFGIYSIAIKIDRASTEIERLVASEGGA